MKTKKNSRIKKRKTIFVTGGAGFIGSSYLNKYVPFYPHYRFVNIDCLTYAGNKKNVTVSHCKNYFFEEADIRDFRKIEKLFIKYNPNSIIHFAAESHVDASIKDQNIFIETNIFGTHNLLALAKKYKTERFHQISTDEVYGSLSLNDKNIFSETSILAPSNPYSASKAGAEFLVMAYNKTFGLNTVITRSSNNYGPNQDATKFIPLFITNLLSGKRLPLYGSGSNIRNWIYVDDNISAIDLVFRKAEAGSIYNISGNCELSNIDVVKKLIELAGKTEKEIKYVSDRPGHDFRYAMSSEKIEKKFGWRPLTNFADGICQTFLFYKKNYSKKYEQNNK